MLHLLARISTHTTFNAYLVSFSVLSTTISCHLTFGRDDAAPYVEEGDTQFLLLDFQACSTLPIVLEEILGLTYT